MNNKFALYLLLAAAATCYIGLVPLPCKANEFLDEVDEVMNPDASAPSIESTDVGYDLRKDLFYFSDDLVEKAYKRSRYADTKITLAGQRPDMTGSRVAKAINPFAVAQKSVGISGSSADRWDVKQDANGNQYMALYHGYKSHFVVNKLRAHLLRRVANVVKNYLPVLDSTYKLIESQTRDEYTGKVREEIIGLIRTSFQDVDAEIREQLKDSDDSAASATVVILTHNFVIVASSGEGRVLAYDGASATRDLSPQHPAYSNNLFGSKKTRPVLACDPYVEVYQRVLKDEDDYDYEIQFLLLETPIVANLIADDEAIKTVLSSVKSHKSREAAEQYLYSDSVNNLMKAAAKKGGLRDKLSNTDYSVLLVGLQTNYKQIY